jgi:hypothetical protein
MKYQTKEVTIRSLINLIKENQINLRPSYQRNFIWGPADQKSLIETIMKGWPLPNFFIYNDGRGNYEMVDGQQRSRTIFKYSRNEFRDKYKKAFNDIDKEIFLNYRLVVIELSDLNEDESLEDFYTIVNKRGKHLNPAEVNYAEHHDTPFMNLVQELMDQQQLIDLDLFNDSVAKRMNDRSLIEELVAVLFGGIKDKRQEVEKLFEKDLSEEDVKEKKNLFEKILERLTILNNIHPIKDTRYKQRNDFYTLFCFIKDHLSDSVDCLKEQYRLLVFISDRGDIKPTNDECETLKDYAINCVTQSNSKSARLRRLEILNNILCNKGNTENEDLYYIENYYLNVYNLDEIEYKTVGEYNIIDIEKLK